MEVGDRGNLVVDIPTAVLPYVPKLYTENGRNIIADTLFYMNWSN